MSVFVMEWVMDNSRAKPTARFVLVAIARRAHHDGGGAHPSSADLQRATGFSERAVRDAIKEAVSIGELEVRYGAGPNGCNAYRIIMTPAGDAAPTESTRQEMPPAGDAPRQEMPERGAGAASLTRQELPPNSPITVLEQSLKTNTGDDGLFDTPADPPKRKRTTKPKTSTDPTADEKFMLWWRTFPNAVKRPASYQKWLLSTKTVDPDELQAKTEAYAKAYAASGNDPKWIPMSTTWLHNEQWNDPLPRSRASPQANGHQPFLNPQDSSSYYGDL